MEGTPLGNIKTHKPALTITRAVESDFKKSNKSQMPKSFQVVFIRFLDALASLGSGPVAENITDL